MSYVDSFGSAVRAKGLVGAAHLNGMWGVVERSDSERVQVRFSGSGEVKRLRRANLELAATVCRPRRLRGPVAPVFPLMRSIAEYIATSKKGSDEKDKWEKWISLLDCTDINVRLSRAEARANSAPPGITPLSMALQFTLEMHKPNRAMIKRVERVVRTLLDAGHMPNVPAGQHCMDMSPLSLACGEDGAWNEESVTLLLAAGADPNFAGDAKAGHCPLRCAAKGGHHKLIKLLLAAGALVETPRVRILPTHIKECMTPLSTAAYHGHRDIVETLLKAGALANPPFYSQEYAGNTPPIYDAIRREKNEIACLLADHGGDPNVIGVPGVGNFGSFALGVVAQSYRTSGVQALLSLGGDIWAHGGNARSLWCGTRSSPHDGAVHIKSTGGSLRNILGDELVGKELEMRLRPEHIAEQNVEYNLQRGVKVALCGLVSAAQYNGKVGIIAASLPGVNVEEERYEVLLKLGAEGGSGGGKKKKKKGKGGRGKKKVEPAAAAATTKTTKSLKIRPRNLRVCVELPSEHCDIARDDVMLLNRLFVGPPEMAEICTTPGRRAAVHESAVAKCDAAGVPRHVFGLYFKHPSLHVNGFPCFVRGKGTAQFPPNWSTLEQKPDDQKLGQIRGQFVTPIDSFVATLYCTNGGNWGIGDFIDAKRANNACLIRSAERSSTPVGITYGSSMIARDPVSHNWWSHELFSISDLLEELPPASEWTWRDGVVKAFCKASGEHLIELRDAARTTHWRKLIHFRFRDWSKLPRTRRRVVQQRALFQALLCLSRLSAGAVPAFKVGLADGIITLLDSNADAEAELERTNSNLRRAMRLLMRLEGMSRMLQSVMWPMVMVTRSAEEAKAHAADCTRRSEERDRVTAMGGMD